jgi:hypothetical protein
MNQNSLELVSLLLRAMRYLVGQGIGRFLDLGSGIRTVGNVHQAARAASGCSDSQRCSAAVIRAPRLAKCQ